MSEITRVEDPPMIRFGKHAGKSAAEVMATDPKYVQWMLAQPWFQEKNPQLVQFFVSGGREASETPEHNAMQAKFTQDAYCLAVAAMFSAGQRLRTAAEVQSEAVALAGSALGGRISSWHPRIDQRSFETNAWDVLFTFTGAFSAIDTSSDPECSCTPLPLPDVPDEPDLVWSRWIAGAPEEATQEQRRLHDEYRTARDSHKKVSTINRNRGRTERGMKSLWWVSWVNKWESAKAFETYSEATRHETTCPKSSSVYFRAWCLEDNHIDWRDPVSFGLELKPSMGDDFPAVLRQVLRYHSRTSYARAAVVVGEFQSATVPWNIVKKQFWESGVLLVREAELDTLVENHADEWGTSLDTRETDFTVEFKDQL